MISSLVELLVTKTMKMNNSDYLLDAHLSFLAGGDGDGDGDAMVSGSPSLAASASSASSASSILKIEISL